MIASTQNKSLPTKNICIYKVTIPQWDATAQTMFQGMMSPWFWGAYCIFSGFLPDPETAAGCGRYRDHVIGHDESMILRCILHFSGFPQPDPETAAGCGRYRDHVIGLEELIILRCILLMFHGTSPEWSRMFHSLSRQFTTQNWLGAPRRARVKMFSWPKHLKNDRTVRRGTFVTFPAG